MYSTTSFWREQGRYAIDAGHCGSVKSGLLVRADSLFHGTRVGSRLAGRYAITVVLRSAEKRYITQLVERIGCVRIHQKLWASDTYSEPRGGNLGGSIASSFYIIKR